MTNSNQICFYPESGDTNSFGSSVAINDKYLAVGDPNANRVVIYQSNLKSRWQRTSEIYPPENSPAFKIGNGFGRDLTLDKDTLMINAITQKKNKRVDIYNPEPIFFGDYLIELDKSQTAISIDVHVKREGSFDLKYQKNGSSIQFYVLSERKPKFVALSNNNEEFFGASIAAHKNLLLVGSPSRHVGGKGWLYNLDDLDNQPIELITTENVNIGTTVAISEQFAAVGNTGIDNFIEDDISHHRTLIRSVKNGCTTLINSEGYLSLYKNILAIMLPASRRLMQSSQLQLFHLNEDATPYLILKRKSSKEAWTIENKYLVRAWVRNGWLITINSINDKGSISLCLESIEQIVSK